MVKLVKICKYEYNQNEYLFVRVEISQNMLMSNTVLNIFIQNSIGDTA
jgi:hypothetical protein